MQPAGRPANGHSAAAAEHGAMMASAVSFRSFPAEDVRGHSTQGPPELSEGSSTRSVSGLEPQRGRQDIGEHRNQLNSSERPVSQSLSSNPNVMRCGASEALLQNLNSVYFREADAASEAGPGADPAVTLGRDQANAQKVFSICVAWELEQLPKDGELLVNVVARLEHLKGCGEEVRRILRDRVAERQEELTKAASVLGELREALGSLSREVAAMRGGFSHFRRECLLPSLEITKRQEAKVLLQREMQHLLQIQRIEAVLMAAEDSCVSRQLPLQAALLVEGVALSTSQIDALPIQASPTLCIQSGISKMQQMMDSLKADLYAALQAAARSLPPPPCSCGWRQPERFSRGPSHSKILNTASTTRPQLSAVGAAAGAGPAEGTWPLYYSALASFALLPPSSPVGSALSAAVAAAAAAAARQVVCAFVPADAAAFSETEAEGLEAHRAYARLYLESHHQPAASAAGIADAVAALPAAKGLAASVDPSDAAACFMTLLGVQYDFLVGASALMRWHAGEALRLLTQVRAERSSNNDCAKGPPWEADLPELPGDCDYRGASYRKLVSQQARQMRNSAQPSSFEGGYNGTCELAASAAQRLRRLPSALRMALFLLQVRRQFLTQRSSLWQQLQQQTAEVLEQLDLSNGGPSALTDCVSLMHAVRVFVAVGDSFVTAEDPAAESRLAAQAADVAATVAASDAAAPAGMHSELSEVDGEAAAAVAADAAAAAVSAAGALAEANAEASVIPRGVATGRLSEVLLARVKAAIESLHVVHLEQLLQNVRTETWQRLPMLRRFPLVLLRTPSSLGGLRKRLQPGNVVSPAAVSAGSSAVCSCCGEMVTMAAVSNPFARWHPGQAFAGADAKSCPQEKVEATDTELEAIEDELRAAEACEWRRRGDEPPVAVAASLAAAKAFMQYWQLAVSAPEVTAAAVKAMIRLSGFYVAAVAAATLPEETCIYFSAPPLQVPAHFGESGCGSKITANADAATQRCRLPHLHWLLSQTERDLRPLHKKLVKGSGVKEMGSCNANTSNSALQPVICELIRPMARLASPGALWGLAERVAAVESASDLLEALAQQLHLQGLPRDFGGESGCSGDYGVPHQQRQLPIGRGTGRGIVGGLPREEQQQLWRLLAATRCGVEDLRALMYRLAAASLCQSSTFLASLDQAAIECGSDWSASAGMDCSRGGTSALQCASDAVPRAYILAVQQQRLQVADLYWKIRCAGSGSIPADIQLLIWRSVRSQTVADAIEALSAIPLAADSVEDCLNPGPLVALAEALREVIAEAGMQFAKAAAAAGASCEDHRSSHPPGVARNDSTALNGTQGLESSATPFDLTEADFDSFLDVCARTAPEVLHWCQEQRQRAFRPQGEGGCRAPPLRVLSKMLQRMENTGLLQKGQTAEFESRHSSAPMQRVPPPRPPP